MSAIGCIQHERRVSGKGEQLGLRRSLSAAMTSPSVAGEMKRATMFVTLGPPEVIGNVVREGGHGVDRERAASQTLPQLSTSLAFASCDENRETPDDAHHHRPSPCPLQGGDEEQQTDHRNDNEPDQLAGYLDRLSCNRESHQNEQQLDHERQLHGEARNDAVKE